MDIQAEIKRLNDEASECDRAVSELDKLKKRAKECRDKAKKLQKIADDAIKKANEVTGSKES